MHQAIDGNYVQTGFVFYVQSITYEASGSHFLILLIRILRINLAKIYNLSIVDTKLFICKNCDNSWVLVGHVFYVY